MTTVLVVDDEPLIAMAMQSALEDAGYHALTAANGKQALERLAQTPGIAIILLDMMMPVMNGAATLKAIQENMEWRHIPIIILSSLPRETILAQTNGAAGILQKPYTADEVLEEMARIIGPCMV